MRVDKILALIPDDLLTGLAIETGVDYYAKKLQGRVLFRLLLYSLLTQKDNSLRSIASIYESALFNMLNPAPGLYAIIQSASGFQRSMPGISGVSMNIVSVPTRA
jgi:hypothetical protein